MLQYCKDLGAHQTNRHLFTGIVKINPRIVHSTLLCRIQACMTTQGRALHRKPPAFQRVFPREPMTSSSGGHAKRRCIGTRSCAIDVATNVLFVSSTMLAAFLAVLMIFFPKWKKAQKLIYSQWPLLLIASTYGILLSWSWQPDNLSLILPGNLAEGLKNGWNPQFFPKLSGIVLLFSRMGTAVSLWVHLLGVNLFAARSICIDGE
jgi:hypothetical protein